VDVINFIKEYWVLITFFIGEIGTLFVFVKSIHRGTKCSLRNDVLEIYDRCKPTKKITRYQLQSTHFTYNEYKKLGGNSFVDEIMEEIKDFEIVD
jgi:hypothetical protein